MKNFLLVLLTLCSFSAMAQTVTVNPDPVVFGTAATNVTITVTGASNTTNFELFSSASPSVALLTADASTTPALTSIGGGAIITITFSVAVAGGDPADVMAASNTTQFFGLFKDAGGFVTAPAVINASLPIELKSFTASNKEDAVALSWVTSTEENNDYFTVERSFDGREFTAIEKIEGAGTSEEEIAYDFADENVTRVATANTAYYRLKQTDYDGAFAYSDIVAVKLENRAELTITNVIAAGNDLSVNFTAPVAGTTEIQVYDMTGRLISNVSQGTEEGFNSANVNLNTNQNGMFIVRVSNGQTQTVHKFVK